MVSAVVEKLPEEKKELPTLAPIKNEVSPKIISSVSSPVQNQNPKPVFQSAPPQSSQPLSASAKKRRRKKKNRGTQGGQNFGSPNQSAPVAIVDTAQKGISLSTLQPAQPKPPERKENVPPQNLSEPTRVQTMPQINTVSNQNHQAPKILKSGQVTKID